MIAAGKGPELRGDAQTALLNDSERLRNAVARTFQTIVEEELTRTSAQPALTPNADEAGGTPGYLGTIGAERDILARVIDTRQRSKQALWRQFPDQSGLH